MTTDACRVCGERFTHADHLALHLGRLHADVMAVDEARAFDEARAREEAWVTLFRRHVKGGTAALPLVLTYAFVILLGSMADIVSLSLGAMLGPGVLVFSALAYYMAYTKETHDAEVRATERARSRREGRAP